jgi:hypothetical protein
MPSADRVRDDSIAIGDIIANIPADELRDLVERDALEDYVEDRLAADGDDQRAVTAAEAVTRARHAARDVRDADDDAGLYYDTYPADYPPAQDYSDDGAGA